MALHVPQEPTNFDVRPVSSMPGVDVMHGVDPNAFGAGIARASEGASQSLEGVEQRAAQMHGEAATAQAALQFNSDVEGKLQQDWMNRKNQDADGLPQEAEKYMTDRRNKIAQTLPMAYRGRFIDDTLRRSYAMQDAVDSHTRQQMESWHLGIATAAIQKNIGNAASNWTQPALLAEDKKDLEKGISGYIFNKNLSGDQADQYAREQRTNFHAAVANGMLNAQKPEDAQKYVSGLGQDEWDAARKHEVVDQIESKILPVKAQQGVSDILDLHKDGPNGTIDFAAVHDDIDATTPDGKLRGMQHAIADKKDAEQKQALLADKDLGRNNIFDWVSKGNTLLDMTPADAERMHIAPDDRLHIAELQSSAQTSGEKKNVPVLTKKGMDLLDRVMAYDPGADRDHSQQHSLQSDILSLQLENHTAAEPAFKAMNDALNPDKNISKDNLGVLYGKKGDDIPGGLRSTIYNTIQKGAEWHTYNPATWGGKAPSAQQIADRSATVFERLKAAVKGHPDWQADDIQKYWDDDPEMKQMRTDSLIGSWHNTLTTGKAEASATFNPESLKKEGAQE